MVVDEFYFHAKRKLGRWESIGHPLDSLTVLAAFVYLLVSAPGESSLTVYICLAAFSSLFITKDEWVHRESCDALENWLHAVLFILHPLVFFGAGFLWWQGSVGYLQVQTAVVAGFMVYQLLRWKISWQKPT
jgi:hypothetical protein